MSKTIFDKVMKRVERTEAGSWSNPTYYRDEVARSLDIMLTRPRPLTEAEENQRAGSLQFLALGRSRVHDGMVEHIKENGW